MISEHSLVEGNAFSSTEQPYLSELFDVVAGDTIPVTFVVGAGSSIQASLPSWQVLIERMCEKIRDPELRKLALAEKTDPMRKAEFVLEMAIEETMQREDEVIRDALYQTKKIPPGPLAHAIAKLAAALGDKRARIITTNFDGLIETSLSGHLPPSQIKSMSVTQQKRWRSEAGVGTVLHIHGMVVPNKNPLEPLILSESHFLKYGPIVRSLILNQLKKSCVIFVGVSITDPNLTGPLWDARGDTTTIPTKPFVLIVPESSSPGSQNDREEKRYALKKAQYLESKLGMRPIFLKSHSQLVQVLWDLDLALTEPSLYVFTRKDPQSLAYGPRFQRRLNACYSAIGCPAGGDFPPYNEAQKLSERLHDGLNGTGALAEELRKLRRKYKRQSAPDESFALFLWLRSRQPGASGKAPYALTQVGNSAHVHREPWSNRGRRVPIVGNSDYPAARAVFRGTNLLGSLPSESPYRIWEGMLAVPVRIKDTAFCKAGSSHGLDILTVGTITLNTTHEVDKEKVDNSDNTSVLACLSTEELSTLAGLLEDFSREILK
ncbi:hypothetical protein QFZ22_007199 [Streptomyces canus]|uniref:SIR2-like domain-containing protein n=1 Tax=Streptomyces canus TaxID=58343 RepID=A0AAW8FN18_9ACTN|nr:SIR2 family protein [Streptomyces canus]MDQ0911214.1 hypothetical protein [Streptomyces canus]